MTTAFIHLLGLLSYFALACAMIVLARLSRRLGHVTHAKPYYWLFYLASAFIGGALGIRFYFITQIDPSLGAINDNLVYTLVSDALLASGVTLGLIVAWYYWSWLLAERD